MLFDFYMDEASPFYIVDVGLCKPIGGNIPTRSFRGRYWRKMISWKGMECTPSLSLDMEVAL